MQRRIGSLIDRLESEMDAYTPSHQLIANFIIKNGGKVAFETASSLADKLGVSPVTVGRFCRHLGYRNFSALKSDLRVDIAAMPWPEGAQLTNFLEHGDEQGRLRRNLKVTVAGLMDVYSMAQTPEWDEIASLLAKAPVIHVVGFQTERGLAAHFAHLLQYVRRRVHLIDLTAGNFADVLADGSPDHCLVVIETRRYSKQALMLCEHAAKQKLDVVVITDTYSDWASKFTSRILAISTESELFWNSLVPLFGALHLLANSVVGKLGAGVETRLATVSKLYQEFSGHIGHRKRS